MADLFLHKTILLRELIAMLHDEGITISTATAIEMEKAMERMNYEYGNNLASLKYYLSPLISRNKEDQENIHHIFDRLDEKAGNGYIDNGDYKKIPPPDHSDKSSSFDKKDDSKEEQKSVWKKVWLIAAAVVVLVGLWILFRNIIFPPLPPPTQQIIIAAEKAILNEPVKFSAELSHPETAKQFSVDWQFADTAIINSFSVQKTFLSAGPQKVIASIKNKDGVMVAADTLSFEVLCENPPLVIIRKIADAAGTQKTKYAASFVNASKDSSQYRYKWFADNKLISEKAVLDNIRQFNTIRLLVNFDKGIHCSTDSLTATLNATPSLAATVIGDGNYTPPSPVYNWKNIMNSLLLLLLAPLIPAFLIYKLTYRFFQEKKETETKKIKPTEGPYKIEFLNQEHLISSEPEVDKLSDLLRKRQVSEMQRLNIRKTIKATVAQGGMPMLQYTPLTKPVSYLVFIDKTYPDSHLVKLFEWLVAKLQKEQVDITIYEYYKEPLYLSNEKLNQLRIPIERVAAHYPGSTVFVFGDARHFVYPVKGILKSWVTDKFSNWDTKILVTPFAKNDWDKKELAIAEAGFIIVPADISASFVIEDVINRHIESQAQVKHPAPAAYPARFLNFNELETLKEYLNNDHLVQWVCSLAVFPSVDWNLTIALGKAIENDLYKKGNPAELVNYTNLLKIGRIAWMHHGIMPDSLRSKMLEQLDSNSQLLARQTLLHQLALIKKTMPVTDASLIKHEMDIHEKMNEFLIKSYSGKQISKDEKAFIRNIIKKHQLDQAQQIFLNHKRNSPLPHPVFKKRNVGLDHYFELAGIRNKIFPIAAGVVSFIFLAVLSSLYINNTDLSDWSKPGTRDLSFNIKVPRDSMPYLYATIEAGDSARGFVIADEDITTEMKGLTILGSSQSGNFILTTSSEERVVEVSFKLNADNYNITINHVKPLSVTLYYNNGAALALANAIEQNLPANYTVTKAQQAITDTSLVIYYADDSLADDAQNIAALASAAAGNRPVRQINSNTAYVNVAAGTIAMYVTSPKTCSPLGVNALSSSLSEIWIGGTSRRYININLPARLIYYSNDNARSYVKYSIDEVCLTGSGAYKIIAGDNDRRYKLFFIRNVRPQSFELSVCEGLTNTKEELQNKDESNCDRFNSMNWYYENDPSKIYLPVNNASLNSRERVRLARKADSLKNNQSSLKYSIQLFTSGYTSQVSANTIKQYLNASNFPYSVSRNNSLLNFSSTMISGNEGPFERSYLVINLERDVTPPLLPQSDTPDCSRTFTLTSAAQVSRRVVCRLNLSNEKLTAIPTIVYSFVNLLELNLGVTVIPKTEIDQLQKQLPKCKIIYTIDKNPEPDIKKDEPPNETEKESLLGYISFDEKGGSPDKESYMLLERIAKQLKAYPNSKIRLEADESYDIYMKALETPFKNIGINPSQVIRLRVRNQQQQQQQQIQQPVNTVKIVGINFPQAAAK